LAERRAAEERIAALEEKLAKMQSAQTNVASSLIAAIKPQLKQIGGEPPTPSALPDTWPYQPYAKVLYPIVTQESDPKFSLPDSAKGYSLQKPAGLLRDLKCPLQSVPARKGNIRLSFVVLDQTTLNRISPVEIEVMRQSAPDKLELYFSRFLPTKVGINLIDLESNFSAGKHIIRIGYYVLSELSRDYPMFYFKDCSFTATA
jgi:hypothetical protein